MLTSSPTASMPTVGPTTFIPSEYPSLAGWIATITATTVSTQRVDNTQIEDFTLNIADFYGVNPADVTPVVTYETSGSMTISIPETVPEAELVDAITSSIAESLNVHPSNVDITIDMDTGTVEFVISTEDFDEIASMKFDLENGQYRAEITTSIENTNPSVTVEEYQISDDIMTTIKYTIDANKANNDLTQAAWQSEQLLSSFHVNIESKFFPLIRY